MRCCQYRCHAFSGYMSMQAVLIPLLSVPLLSAPLSLCLYACIVSAVLFCAVWTAAAVCPPPLSVLAAHSIAADTALQNTMVSCNIAFLRFLHFKGGVMITKTFAINYLHLYGVFCNASYLLWLVLIRCEYQPFSLLCGLHTVALQSPN